MRRFAALLPLALAACQSAHAAAPPASAACIAVPANDIRAALAEEDRQIATLRSLVAVSGLNRTSSAAARSAALARASSQHAADDVAALARSAPTYALDPVTIRSGVQREYAREAGLVRSQAQRAHDAYASALNEQVNRQASSLANALAQRVDDAYAARIQQDTERENDAQVACESAVADRQLQLRIKLAALARTPAQRNAVKAQLERISHALDTAAAADRARDRAAELRYRASLEAAASAEYASTLADLRKKAAANLALRSRVNDAQRAAPATLAMSVDASRLQSAQANAGSLAQQMRSGMLASGRDIAQRLSAIGASDAANAASLHAQLAAMLRARAALAAATPKTCRSR